MKDRNGKEITVGARAVLLKSEGMPELIGRIGTIRAMRTAAENHRKRPVVRISEGPEGDWEWSSWSKPTDVALV